MVGHEHTDRQFSFQYEVGAKYEYGYVDQTIGKHRQQCHLCLLLIGIAVYIKFVCPQSAPIFEEACLGSSGLDALHVVDTRDGGREILSLALFHRADEVDALIREKLYDGEVDARCQDAYHRQPERIGQHQQQIEHQEADIDDLRGEHFHQRVGNALVQVHALL